MRESLKLPIGLNFGAATRIRSPMRSSQHNTVAAAIGGGMVLGLAAFLAGRAIVRARRRISVNGLTALITGGSRGIGLQIALELARRGAKIAIAAGPIPTRDRLLVDVRAHAAQQVDDGTSGRVRADPFEA